MTYYEYYKAKEELVLQKKVISKLCQNAPTYRKELQKLIELLLAVKGHAWCMDVKSERRKTAKLLVGAFGQLRDKG